jgi:hypothetical protein
MIGFADYMMVKGWLPPNHQNTKQTTKQALNRQKRANRHFKQCKRDRNKIDRLKGSKAFLSLFLLFLLFSSLSLLFLLKSFRRFFQTKIKGFFPLFSFRSHRGVFRGF